MPSPQTPGMVVVVVLAVGGAQPPAPHASQQLV
jgi:hypothetical protein